MWFHDPLLEVSLVAVNQPTLHGRYTECRSAQRAIGFRFGTSSRRLNKRLNKHQVPTTDHSIYRLVTGPFLSRTYILWRVWANFLQPLSCGRGLPYLRFLRKNPSGLSNDAIPLFNPIMKIQLCLHRWVFTSLSLLVTFFLFRFPLFFLFF